MAVLGLAANHLGPNDVADAVGHKHGGGSEALLGLAGDVGGSESDGEGNDGAEESDERVADNGGHGAVSPVGLPDNGKAGNDGETACQEHEDAQVSVAGANPSSEGDANGADGAEGKLEEDALQWRVAKRRDDEGAKP